MNKSLSNSHFGNYEQVTIYFVDFEQFIIKTLILSEVVLLTLSKTKKQNSHFANYEQVISHFANFEQIKKHSSRFVNFEQVILDFADFEQVIIKILILLTMNKS